MPQENWHPQYDTVVIDYTNHRGERAKRVVTPHNFRFKASVHHDDSQWIMEAFDHGKGAFLDFAMKDIHGWKPYVDPTAPPRGDTGG
jgi:predicted DNA-binding transcriptional regulator YafY